VPRSFAELVRYRRRRGGGLVHEVREASAPGAPAGFRRLRALRHWQLRGAPRVALALTVAAPFLFGVPGLLGPLGLGLALGVPFVLAARADGRFADERRPLARIPLAWLRLLLASGLALLVPGHGRSPARGGSR